MWGRKGVAQNFNDPGELKITKGSAAVFYHHSTFLQSLTIYLLSFATFSAVFDFEVVIYVIISQLLHLKAWTRYLPDPLPQPP